LHKVGSSRGLRFDVARDSWAHRTLGAPYIRPPYLLLGGMSPIFNLQRNPSEINIKIHQEN